MEWSNLNEQMIEQFFQHSSSPTSNADVSLNFTRTSRQSGSNSKHHINHRQSPPKLYQKSNNVESDLLSTADMEIQKFDEWLNAVGKKQQMQGEEEGWMVGEVEGDNEGMQMGKQSLQNQILQKIQNISHKLSHQPPPPHRCPTCPTLQAALSQLQTHTTQLQTQLASKSSQLSHLNHLQLTQLLQQLPYSVQNRLLHQQVTQLKTKTSEILQILQRKQLDINKLNEEIEKFNLERSTYYFKNRTLENKVLEMEKSRTMLSATKHSTSHSEFNVTTSNNSNSSLMMMKSQPQSNINIDSTLINTNHFTTQKPSPQDYILWFDKVKQVFLQKYRMQQKQYLLKQHPQAINNDNKMKQIINEFRRKHVRYEVAKSCKNIAQYIKKNKENFFDVIGNQTLGGVRVGVEASRGRDCGRSVDQVEEELRKQQKISKGLESEICHLNNQLATLKKTLIKQKQQKSHLRQQLHQTQLQLRQCLDTKPPPSPLPTTLHHQLQSQLLHLQQQLVFKSEQLTFKTQQLKKMNYKCKRQQETQQKLQLAVKESEYLLYKQRKDKIRLFRQTLPPAGLTTACCIRPKAITEKHLTSIVHQLQGKLYVDKQKLSYKYDIIEQVGKKAESEILLTARKIVGNCVYEGSCSLFLSMGAGDSEFREYMRGEKGLMWGCVGEMFRLRECEKRFLQITVTVNVIGMLNTQVYDALDRQNPQKKISIKREGTRFSLLNCLTLTIQTQHQLKSLLTPLFSSQRPSNYQSTNLITIFELSMMDKRSKQKYTSKMIFGEVGLYINSSNNSKQQQQGYGSSSSVKDGVQNLIKDSQALWNVFNSMNFKQKYQPQFNRLTHLLSECLNQNSKNLLVMNISPTQMYKQISIASLTYGSSLKGLGMQVSTTGALIVRLAEKEKESGVGGRMVVVAGENKSQSLIKQQVVGGDGGGGEDNKGRPILKHRNSSSQHPTSSGAQTLQKKKRTISRLSIC